MEWSSLNDFRNWYRGRILFAPKLARNQGLFARRRRIS